LDGHKATTNSLFLDTFREAYPLVDWISLADNLDTCFIESTPQIATCAGTTAGIDGTLHRIEAWCGHDVAEATRECLEWPLHFEEDSDGENGSGASFRGNAHEEPDKPTVPLKVRRLVYALYLHYAALRCTTLHYAAPPPPPPT
jgi:transcriptional regulator GlxA family with amidase domain